MDVAKFWRTDEFLIRHENLRIEATNGVSSYGFSLDPGKHKPVLDYIESVGKDTVDVSVERSSESALVLSFAENFEGMKLNTATIELSTVSPVKCIDWATELVQISASKENQLELQKTLIHNQDVQIEQMIVAKEKYQDEMLERVCAILEARHGGHASMLDIYPNQLDKSSTPKSPHQEESSDVKLESPNHTEHAELKIEMESPSQKYPAAYSTSDSETETTEGSP